MLNPQDNTDSVKVTESPRFVTLSRSISRSFPVSKILGSEVEYLRYKRPKSSQIVLGWGRKEIGLRAHNIAQKQGSEFWCIEDGFLRSFNTGQSNPPLSIVLDKTGIFYDSTSPSDLENLLNSEMNLLEGILDDVIRARQLILLHELSKYNHAPQLPDYLLRKTDVKRVLVVDQTVGDMSIILGGADAGTFETMLNAAFNEHPEATIYVKTHPEVSAGTKKGYLSGIVPSDRIVLLTKAINPISLIKQVDHVYVVSSTMGFEALLADKPVVCFGLAWYAGWGVTDDRQFSRRRLRTRTILELFAGAYFHYAKYLDPITYKPGNIFSIIEWLIRQKDYAQYNSLKRCQKRAIVVGMQHWKKKHVLPFLSPRFNSVEFLSNIHQVRQLNFTQNDVIVCWGMKLAIELKALAHERKSSVLIMEDGFIRSVGLGSDFIPPMSLVMDAKGIYFDPGQTSDLEHILNADQFTKKEIEQAKQLRSDLIKYAVTKYNLEPTTPVRWSSHVFNQKRKIILVPGQVEDDASIRYGCFEVGSNFDLLKATRIANPEAFIVYKPHPDVISSNRQGKLSLSNVLQYADHIETEHSIISCINACDELHTMTSLSGFDALIREKKVVVYGQPFYAGWGLTIDKSTRGKASVYGRRQRQLTLDELAAGVLLRYPIYWDWNLQGVTSCQAVLMQIVKKREYLETINKMKELNHGSIKRIFRKLKNQLNGF